MSLSLAGRRGSVGSFSLKNGDDVPMHPLIALCGKMLPPQYQKQKPVYATSISVAGIDTTSRGRKSYYAVVAAGEQSEPSLLLIRTSSNGKLRHHRTLFSLAGARVTCRKVRGDEVEIEISWGSGSGFTVNSLSTGENYAVPGALVLCPDGESEDKSLVGLFYALEKVGLEVRDRPKMLESRVTEEDLTGKLRVLLEKMQRTLANRTNDQAKLSNLFRLLDEAILTEVQYLCSYDRYQTSLVQIEAFLTSFQTLDASSNLTSFLEAFTDVGEAATAAVEQLLALQVYLRDSDKFLHDEATQVVDLCEILDTSADKMLEAEKKLLLKTAKANACLKELRAAPNFQNFEASLELSGDSKKLPDYVSSTMQRVTRRPLLMENLFKDLKELDCFSEKQLVKVVSILEAVRMRAMAVNEAMAMAEMDLCVIAEQLKPAINVNESGRECIYIARVKSAAAQAVGLDKVPATLFVFNDCMLVAKPVANSQQYVFQSAYAFKTSTVEMKGQVLSIKGDRSDELELGMDATVVLSKIREAQAIVESLPAMKLPAKEQRLSAMLSRLGLSVRGRASPPRQSTGDGSFSARSATPSRPSTPSRQIPAAIRSATPTPGQSRPINNQAIRAPSPGMRALRPSSPGGGGKYISKTSSAPTETPFDRNKGASATPRPAVTPAKPLVPLVGSNFNRATPSQSAVKVPVSASIGGTARFLSTVETPKRASVENIAPMKKI